MEGDTARAIEIAQRAFDAAMAEIKEMDETGLDRDATETYRDAMLLVGMLRDKITEWT